MQTSNALSGIQKSECLLFPKFLLNLRISETAKIIYIMLFNRFLNKEESAPKCINKNNRIYIHYTFEELAKDMHKSPSTIRVCIKELKEIGLIEIEPVYGKKPSKIYVNYPTENNQ